MRVGSSFLVPENRGWWGGLNLKLVMTSKCESQQNAGGKYLKLEDSSLEGIVNQNVKCQVLCAAHTKFEF